MMISYLAEIVIENDTRAVAILHATEPVRRTISECIALLPEDSTATIEADEDGFFVSCPALQGCYSQGGTYEEAVQNIKDAIKLHIADRLADSEEIPQVSVSLSTVEI